MSKYIPTVYLAGPVQHSDDGGAGWRDETTERYGGQFEFRNPLDKYDTAVENVEWLQPGETKSEYPDDVEVYHADEIIADDKAMIDECDFVFIGLQDIVPMYGTPREHEYAVQTDTPVVVWYREGMEVPIWAIGDSAFLSDDRQDCMEFIYTSQTKGAVRADMIDTITEHI